jgi:TonB family protein
MNGFLGNIIIKNLNRVMKKLAILSVCLLMAGVSFARTDADSTAAKTDQPTQDVITQPEFRGGIEKMYQYISDNFEYPEDAAKRSVNGKMDVEFTVEKSGDITYVGILKGLDYSIDGEVLRLLKAMPRWIPATKNGEPVRYKVSMPITIRASRNKNQKSSTALRDFKDQ